MRWLDNIRIGRRLVIVFSIMIIVTLLLGGVGFLAASQTASYTLPTLSNLSSVQMNALAIITSERGLLLNGITEEGFRASQYDAIGNYRTVINDTVNAFELLPITAEERELVNQYKGLVATWFACDDNLVSLAKQRDALVSGGTSDTDASIQQLDTQLLAASLESRASHKATNAVLVKLAAALNAQATDGAQSAIRIILIAGCAAAVISTLLGFIINRSIGKPLRSTVSLAKALAAGELDHPNTVTSKDEVGQLAQTIDQDVRNAFKNIAEAQVIAEKQRQYQNKQVDKLVVNLERLAKGELYCDMAASEADEDTKEMHQLFASISDNLHTSVNTIRGYIEDLSRVLDEMSNRDFTMAISIDYHGDFVALKDCINNIGAALNEVFEDIKTSANQVASGTQQVSGGSQEISQGAAEQASAIEELTASVTQIADQTRLNAQSASEASQLTTNAKRDAELGNERMKAMQQAMADINDSAANISKIIKVIDEIAFQTNILALNAAVEAARAGIHGKGFAVVAEEVRNLAARSASAAKETTDLIEGSIRKTEVGTKIADETAAALANIVSGVEKAAKLVGEIAEASGEQASAITQVNRGIEQMSQVVQTNSATSEETAAAAEELSSQAELLNNTISQFRLRSGSDNPGTGHIGHTGDTTKPRFELGDTEFGKY